MIETIYSSESVEGDGTGKSQTAFRMPKNIRQVGKSNATKKIYVEDYVMTFVKQLVSNDYSGWTIAVLVGQCIKLENCRNIFISGAVEINDIDPAGEIIFTNDTWAGIYEEIKKYFVETEIVGWFVGGPGYLLAEEDKIRKIHIDNFAGQDKILLTYDNLEKEETFLSYEGNRLCKQDGYYTYYEKNEEMQSYIIEHKKPEGIEVNYNDKVSKDIRTVLQNKKPPEEESKSITKLMYAAGTLLAVIVLIVGAAMLRNYDQMKSMQDTLNYLSKNMEEVQAIFADKGDSETDINGTNSNEKGNKDTDAQNDKDTDAAGTDDTAVTKEASADTSTEDGSLDVEVVPGNVKPIDKDTSKSADGDIEDNNSDGTVSDKELAEDASKADKTSTSEKKDTKTDSTAKKDTYKATKAEVNYYTVETGDTLAGISYKLYKTYTKVDTIMELNGIENQDVIMVGQKLIVP